MSAREANKQSVKEHFVNLRSSQEIAAGDIHHRSVIEQDTAIDLINPGFK
jgi:hypothetical protein